MYDSAIITVARIVIRRLLLRFFGWSPDRGALLSAVALATGSGGDLPATLDLFSNADAALARRLRALAHDLRQGRSLADVLYRDGLVSRAQHRSIAGSSTVPAAIDRAARQVARPALGLRVVRWLPVYVLLAIFGPLMVVNLVLTQLIGHTISQLFRELGITVPALTAFMLHLTDGLTSWAFTAVFLGLTAACCWLISNVRGLRHLLHAWNPEVHRAAAEVDLLAHARWRGGLEPFRIPWWHRPLLGLSRYRQDQPEWDLDWRTWMFLTRFRLRRSERHLLMSLPTLAERLTAIGALPYRAGGPDFDTAEDLAHQRLDQALALARPWWIGLFILVAVPLAIFSNLTPFIRIIVFMSQGF